MLTAEVVTDVTRLLPRYGLADALELVEQKRRGERSEPPEALAASWAARLDRLFALLDDAHQKSVLPAEPSNAEAMERWLVGVRLSDASIDFRTARS